MPGYKVVTTALQSESDKWADLVESIGTMRSATEDLTLGPTAFFIGDVNTIEHHLAYQRFQFFMTSLLSGAVVEFGQVSEALLKVKKAYEEAEDMIELDLNTIYRV